MLIVTAVVLLILLVGLLCKLAKVSSISYFEERHDESDLLSLNELRNVSFSLKLLRTALKASLNSLLVM